MNIRPAFATLCLVSLVGLPATAQSRSERVNQLTASLAGAVDDQHTVYTDARTGETIRATPRQLMRETLTQVDFDEMPGKLALEIWSNQTGVPLVVNWASLEAEGIDPDAPVTLKLNRVPAEAVLKLIVRQMHPDPVGDDQLLVEIEPWFVRVMTKRDALQQSTTRMYFIGDLLMTIPNFGDAPRFDLNSALSNTNSGGSNDGGGGGNNGGGGGNGIFQDNNDNREEQREPSKLEKAEKIMDVIRDSIEPDIWRANGGEYASIRYLRGMLIVKAPDFVHEQIGVPVSGTNSQGRAARRSSSHRSSSSANTQRRNNHQQRRSTSGNVAGTSRSGPRLVR